MLVMICYPGGERVEALLLSASPFTVRVHLPGGGDALELRQHNGQWRDENGAPVEFECVLASQNFDARSILGMSRAFRAVS